METSIPIQYTVVGRMVKKILHTKWGAKLGHYLGLTGFNKVERIVIRKNGQVEKSVSFNSRVNVGAALTASLLSGTTLGGLTSPLPAKYIALSTASLTPNKTDTTLASEITNTNLGRALGTSGTYTLPSVLDGAASYVLTYTFTASGNKTVVSTAIFDAISTGNMLAEANFATSATLANGDQLVVNWTINL